MIKGFSNLHTHSMFSFLDGISTPEEIVVAAKELGLTSVALTDHGHAHGTADFYLAGKKHGVKTVYGVEGYIIHSIEEWRQMKEKIAADKKKTADDEIDLEKDLSKDAAVNKANRRLLNRKGHLVMVASDQEGLSNIYQIVHAAHKYGYYMKPRADKDILRKFSKGVIATSACMGGVISNKLWQLQRSEIEWDEIVREAEEFQDIFGKDRFYLELQFNEHPSQTYINEGLIRLHEQTGIPLTVTADAHYIKHDDWETQQILHLLMTHRGATGGTTLSNLPEGYDFKTRSLFLKSQSEMWDSYVEFGKTIPQKYVEAAFENTLKIDSMISSYEPDTTVRLPTLKYDDTFKELGQRAVAGLKARNLHEDHTYVERLMYELKMVKDKGLSSYFLVVNEITKEASKRMLIGPGRGSAAGSLICYLIGITGIDPIEHNLMFERFINVDRAETPDIDLDFEDVDEVKQILRDKFGEDNVACITSYGTSQIKGLMKDICRVNGIDHAEANKANNMIEKELQAIYAQGEAKSAVIIKLEDVYRLSKTFNAFIDKYPQIKKPIERLYGRAHHVGRHASGVVIGDNLPAETATFYSKGILQTSFTDGVVNKQLSAMGLVKFDILGLTTLKIINHACKLIADRHNMSYEEALGLIDAKRMDFNDAAIMKNVFQKGNLTGIFQVTSPGMKKMIMSIKPDCFNDVAACGALYRPGPLGSKMDKLYAENKQKAKSGEIVYDHPLLEEILKDTYGCFVYQEHILELGRKVGKLSWKDTNRLRKLFLKRTKDKAQERVDEEIELKQKLTDGFIENGLTKEYAEKTWVDLTKWASYGFNAAHAKSYGMVTMQTAYLRHYYPLEFFAAVLTNGASADLQTYVDEIRRQGFKILPVDVNKSQQTHVIEGDAIRLSLGSVKGVGAATMQKVVANQPYTSFLDYLDRSGANKSTTEGLIKVGAFECFQNKMSSLLSFFEKYSENPKLKTKKLAEERDRLFAESLSINEDVDIVQKIEFEREFLEFNIRHSPFSINGRSEKIQRMLDEGLVVDYSDFIEGSESIAAIPVMVKEVKERPQKNKEQMAFVKFTDRNGQEFSAPCFSGIWKHISKVVRKGDAYIVTFNRKDDDPTGLIIGKPGWVKRHDEAMACMLVIDDINF